MSRAMSLWDRARKTLAVARAALSLDPDNAASRAYYAAFYAVSALFALEGREFRRHSAIEAAVHRDLVKAGIWAPELGEDYSELVELRDTGDYGGPDHVDADDAAAAVEKAASILRAVAKSHPDLFASSQ